MKRLSTDGISVTRDEACELMIHHRTGDGPNGQGRRRGADLAHARQTVADEHHISLRGNGETSKSKGKFAKSARDFEKMEDMPAEIRSCIHEFGFEIVSACMNYGVNDPRQIRDLVREVWAGARQPSQSKIGKGTNALNKIDWVLLQAGAGISAERLIRTLNFNGLSVIPMSVTPKMVEASMNALDGHGLVTKQQKHTIRLDAALRAGREAVSRENKETRRSQSP